MVSTVSDGGTWGCPAGGLVYIVDRTNHVLRLKVSTGDSEFMERTTAVAKAIGWTTTDERDNKDNN